MKKYFLLFLFMFPLLVFAQSDNKYLAGAVPEQNGKIVYEKELAAPGLSESQVYDSLLAWAEKRFAPNDKDNWGKIMNTDRDKGIISCLGEEYMVFTNKTFALDRTRIRYVVTLECSGGKCMMKISSISYNYTNVGETVRMPAEEWISDKTALNKKKTKMIPVSKKFRIKTVDLVNELYEQARTALGSGTTLRPL